MRETEIGNVQYDSGELRIHRAEFMVEGKYGTLTYPSIADPTLPDYPRTLTNRVVSFTLSVESLMYPKSLLFGVVKVPYIEIYRWEADKQKDMHFEHVDIHSMGWSSNPVVHTEEGHGRYVTWRRINVSYDTLCYEQLDRPILIKLWTCNKLSSTPTLLVSFICTARQILGSNESEYIWYPSYGCMSMEEDKEYRKTAINKGCNGNLTGKRDGRLSVTVHNDGRTTITTLHPSPPLNALTSKHDVITLSHVIRSSKTGSTTEAIEGKVPCRIVVSESALYVPLNEFEMICSQAGLKRTQLPAPSESTNGTGTSLVTVSSQLPSDLPPNDKCTTTDCDTCMDPDTLPYFGIHELICKTRDRLAVVETTTKQTEQALKEEKAKQQKPNVSDKLPSHDTGKNEYDDVVSKCSISSFVYPAYDKEHV